MYMQVEELLVFLNTHLPTLRDRLSSVLGQTMVCNGTYTTTMFRTIPFVDVCCDSLSL
jgi:hypothetical protein